MGISVEFFNYYIKKETEFIRKLAKLFLILLTLSLILFFCEIFLKKNLFSYLRFILFFISAIITFILIRNSYKKIKIKMLESIDVSFFHFDNVLKLNEDIKNLRDILKDKLNILNLNNLDLIISKIEELNDVYIEKLKEDKTIIYLINELLKLLHKLNYEFYSIIKNELINKLDEKDNFLVNLLRSTFCINCTFIQIYTDFFNIINKKLEDELKLELNNIETLKKNYQIIYSQIEDVSISFVKYIEDAYKTYNISNDQVELFYKDYAKMFGEIEKALSYYYDEFKKIDLILENVENISEQTRIIALNLSIEASKSHENAFNVISKELQNLSMKTQEFIKNISTDIKNSIKKIEMEKEEKLKIIKIINENVEKNKEINSVFSSSIKNLIDVSKQVKKNIELILNDREKLFSLFNLVQNFYLELEIVRTISNFYLEFQRDNSEKVHEMIGGKKGLCASEVDKKKFIKIILEKIRSKITTKLEKDALNEIYLKYTNESIDKNYLEDDKDVIIF